MRLRTSTKLTQLGYKITDIWNMSEIWKNIVFFIVFGYFSHLLFNGSKQVHEGHLIREHKQQQMFQCKSVIDQHKRHFPGAPVSFPLHYNLDCNTFAQKAVSSAVIINFLTIQDVMAQYLSGFLWNIRKISQTDFKNFQLDNVTKSRVISLGIQKQPVPDGKTFCYRRSRAGQKLFHKIHTLVLQVCHLSVLLQPHTACPGVNHDNLQELHLVKLDKAKFLHLAHINTRSIRSKTLDFQEYVVSKDIDVCAVTETWLKEDEIFDKKRIAPIGYSVILHPRRDKRVGGGIAMVYKDNIKVRSVLNGSCGTMEYALFSFMVRESLINLFVIYRFPQH